jgi:chromosome segregation protein
MDGVKAPGLERAIAAALDDDLDAPADVSSPVHWSGTHGDVGAQLPGGATPLSDLVEAPAELHARLTQCGLVDRALGSSLVTQLMPGQSLVSREGDLWRWDGFVRTADAPLTSAEKLEQRARRAALVPEIAAAVKERDASAAVRSKASQQLTDAEITLMAARKHVPERRAAAQAHEAAIRAEQDGAAVAARDGAEGMVRRMAAERYRGAGRGAAKSALEPRRRRRIATHWRLSAKR